MKKILSDFIGLYRSEPLIMILLTWLLLAGSTLSTYAALILVGWVIVNRRIVNGADGMLALIFMYSVFYALFTTLNGYNKYAMGNVLFYSLFPPTFYLIGKYFARLKSEKEVTQLFFLFVTLIAIPVVVDVINDIRENQFINVLRTIEREDGSKAASATNLGIRVSLAVASVGLLFGKCINRYERHCTILFLIVAGLGITCVLHLVNRTGVVLAAVSILIAFLFNFRHLSRKSFIIMIIGMLILTIFYIPQLQFVTDVNEAYVSRDEGASSVATGGGRTDLWISGLKTLWESPLGIPSYERTHYSHNYWLDTNMTGGILAFVFLVVLTIRHIKNSWYVIKHHKAGLLRTLIITTNVGFILTALVEPIMEGFMVYVFLFFMFMGIVQQYRNMLIER